MSVLIPGKPLFAQLDVVNSAGVRVAAGSAPTITVRRNNATEAGVTLTSSNPATGLYLYYLAAVPAWSHGDQVILDADTGSTGAGAFASFTVIDPAIAGAAMTLTPAERLAIAASVEVSLLDDGTNGALLHGLQDRVLALMDQGGDTAVAAIAGAVSAAVWSAGSRTITGGALTTAPPTAAEIAAAILIDASRKLLTAADGKVTATNGGSVDVTAITAAIEAIQASLAILATTPPQISPGLDSSRLNYTTGELGSRSVALKYSYTGSVLVTWESLAGTNLGTHAISAAGSTVAATHPSQVTANPILGRWSIRRVDTQEELAGGLFNVRTSAS